MVQIERVRRPFWVHQLVEYAVGIGLVSASVQMPDPTVGALLGLLVIVNAAIAKGAAGAFRLVGRRLHRVLDLVVVGVLVAFALQPWVSIDNTSRLLIGGVAFILLFVWFYTDYSERETWSERRAARRAASAPADSTEIGRRAGRAVGGAAASVKRWTSSLGDDRDDDHPPAPPPSPPPAGWDPPSRP